MDWDVRLSSRARHALEQMTARDRGRIEAALLDMKRDPHAGDTRPLQGRHQGVFGAA
jgi:hypothetical protein